LPAEFTSGGKGHVEHANYTATSISVMLGTRANDWLSRLQASGPKSLSLVFGALILLQLLQIGYSLLSKPLRTPQPVLPAPALRAQRSGVDVQTVIAAHLFGVPVTDPSTQDPENAPRSSANLLLAGTIATQDPKRGVAIISDGGAPSKVYSVGERIGGAALHSVYLDHVILDRGGALETLLLPRQLPPNGRVTAGRRFTGGDPRTVAAVDNIRRMVQQDPGILDQVMHTVASYDNAAGKLRGFRAYPGRNRAIFAKLGLKPGDLVTAINGTPLDDPQRSLDVFNTIQTSDRVTVTVERGGQRQDITLNIAQVAAQATRDLEGESPNTGPSPNGAPLPPSTSPNSTNENSNE
jgi:general secretion pathway protein C